MEFKDSYKTLGLEPGTDDKAIKTAYRKLSRKHHPDVSKEKDAEDRFKEVAKAYEVLKNADKRAEYNELRQYAHQGQPFEPPQGWQPSGSAGFGNHTDVDSDCSDFLESLFGGADRFHGGHRSKARRGQDVEMDLPLLLEETLDAERKNLLPDSAVQP